MSFNQKKIREMNTKTCVFLLFLFASLSCAPMGDDSQNPNQMIDANTSTTLTLEAPVSLVKNSCMAVTLPGDIDYWGEGSVINPTYEIVSNVGIDIAHVYSSWGYIEVDKNKYNWEYADHLINGVVDRGMRASLVLTTLGPTGIGVMPQDITFTTFDEKEIVERFESFIDKLIKRYGEKISYLWIGNESDIYLGKHRSEIDPYKTFLRAGKNVAQSIQEALQVGVIFAYNDALKNNAVDVIETFQNEVDIIGLTLYPQMLKKKPGSLEGFLSDISKLSDKIHTPVAIVETGWTRDGYGGTESDHISYLKDTLKKSSELNIRSNIKFMCLVGPYDLPKSIVRHFGGNKLPKELQKWLLTLSFISNEGKPNASWKVLVDTMRGF